MTPRFPGEAGADGDEPVQALITDRYLDALLAAAERQADDAPVDVALDPDMRAAMRALRRILVRVHPSFRFEERLAARLADLAALQDGRRAMAAGSGRSGATVPEQLPVRLPGTASPAFGALEAVDPGLAAILAGELDPSAPVERLLPINGVSRPWIVGGAMASAALSLVGVAWVARRVVRPGSRPTLALADSGGPA